MQAGLAFIVLRATWQSLALGYAAPGALAKLRELPGDDALAVFGASDLQEVRWREAAFVLTPGAGARLAAALRGERHEEEGVRRLKALERSLGWGNALERALYNRAFLVRLHGEHLYGGIFLDPPSQMGIDFPVARVSLQDAHVVFHLMPLHLPFFGRDPANEPAEPPTHAEPPTGMIDHFRGMAMSPLAVAQRAMMRDAGLEAWLREAGKLRDG